MRKVLLFPLIGVLLVLLLADRIGVVAAENNVAHRLENDVNVRSTPDVSIHGFPFLTQLVSGDYHDVDVGLHGLDADGLRVERLSIHLTDAHVSVQDVLRQDRSRIRVDEAKAHLLLRYDDLEDFVARHTGVKPPRRMTRALVSAVAVAANKVGLVLHTTFGSIPISLAGLPFGIRLTSAKATQAGLSVTGAATGLQLRS